RRTMRLDQHGQHLERRDQTVAGSHIVAQNYVARLLPADIEATGPHALDHITIAHLSADEVQSKPADIPLQPEVGHHGGDDAASRQLAGGMPGTRDQGHDLIAVDHPPLLIDKLNAIRIPIEGDPDVGAMLQHRTAQRLRMRGSAVQIDVEAVRRDTQRNDLGTELPEDIRRDLVRGAMGTIDDDLQAVETQSPGEAALRE